MRKSRKRKQKIVDSGIIIKNSLLKMTALLLLVGFNWAGLSAVIETFAYFNDTEHTDNQINAGVLDLALSGDSGFTVPVIPSQPVVRRIDILNNGTLPFNYNFKLNSLSGDEELCDELDLKISLDGTEIYSGPLALFSSATSTLAASASAPLELSVSLASEELSLWEKTCSFDLNFSAWQDNLADSSQGFFDAEIINNTVTSGIWGVVLNEFLPNPNGEEYGFDFGQDADLMPKGEWVELYNNDDFDHDLSGWYIQDLANHRVYITADNTNAFTTIITAHNWLVVYMNQAILNNSGAETVFLFDGENNVKDFRTYSGGDYCDLEPTPGDDNDSAPTGSCSSVSGNKSYARIPDGFGPWVDPIPTPGQPNQLGEDTENTEMASSTEILPPTENLNPDASTTEATTGGPAASSSPAIETSATSTDSAALETPIAEEPGGAATSTPPASDPVVDPVSAVPAIEPEAPPADSPEVAPESTLPPTEPVAEPAPAIEPEAPTVAI